MAYSDTSSVICWTTSILHRTTVYTKFYIPYRVPSSFRDRSGKDGAKSLKLTASYTPLHDVLQRSWRHLSKRQTKDTNPHVVFALLGKRNIQKQYPNLNIETNLKPCGNSNIDTMDVCRTTGTKQASSSPYQLPLLIKQRQISKRSSVLPKSSSSACIYLHETFVSSRSTKAALQVVISNRRTRILTGVCSSRWNVGPRYSQGAEREGSTDC